MAEGKLEKGERYMSDSLIIRNGRIVTDKEVIENGILVIEGGKIKAIFAKGDKPIPKSADVIEAEGQIVAPGLLDIHMHGLAGNRVMEGNADSIIAIAEKEVEYGVTSFLPNAVTASAESIDEAIEAVLEAKKRENKGAEILGIRLEGPYLNKIRKGAQPENFIRPADRTEFEGWVKKAEGELKMIDLAPEVEGNLTLLSRAKELGIFVSIGHSNASYEEVVEAIEAGATHITHLFNGMVPFHHRSPGVIGAALTRYELKAELIADGVHVHKAALKLAIKAKGSDGIILITDAMEATGFEDGVYNLGGQKVIIKDGGARLEDGTLAGSLMTMNRAVKNVVEWLGIPLVEAFKMASLNAAYSIGIAKDKGSLEIGKDADIAIFDDELEVQATLVRGAIKWVNPETIIDIN